MARTFLAAWLAGLCALACGGSTSTPKATDVTRFVAGYCEVLSPCCQASGLATDGAYCRSEVESSTKSAGTRFDPAQADTCLADLRAAAAKAGFCATGFRGIPSQACSELLEGNGPRLPGESCSDRPDCAASGAGEVSCETFFVQGSDVRICQVQKVGKAGDAPCLGTVYDAVTVGTTGSAAPPAEGFLCYRADGLYCEGDGKAGCAKLQTAGGSCASADCDDASYCDYANNRCVALAAVGGACASSTACEKAAYCDSTAQKCAAKIANDAACATSPSCLSGSCVNGRCEPTISPEPLSWKSLCGS